MKDECWREQIAQEQFYNDYRLIESQLSTEHMAFSRKGIYHSMFSKCRCEPLFGDGEAYPKGKQSPGEPI
jgi:hypothetical protein